MDHIQSYLDYFTANPTLAIIIIFLVAFGEALLIIGLFVPSTVVLVGAGTLVGTGHLPFWPVMLATVIGAVAGDQVSYWAGRLFGNRLKLLWPLNRYPALVAKGEEFVRSHGGKSIAIGRFVPGVKAVVPGIVGMLGMSQPFFVFVNVTSGILWGAAHVYPGILLGQGLALAGEFSGRLTILLVVLLVGIGVIGWATRIIASGVFSPVFRQLLLAFSHLARRRRTRPFQRLGRALAPENPRAARLMSLALSVVLSAAVVGYLLYRVLTLDVASNFDQSVNGLLQSLRNQPADSAMTAITMLGDWQVLYVMCGAMAVWLLWHRAWRSALAVLLTVSVGQLLTHALRMLVQRERPIVLDGNAIENLYSFPSGHTATTTLVFGLLAVIVGHSMGRWSRALVFSCAVMMICLMGFSRLYLGVHWLSDVLAGAALSAVCLAVFGVVLEAYPARRIRPLGLIGVALVAWLAAAWVDISADFETRLASYAQRQVIVTHSAAEWAGKAWEYEPRRRVDLSGQSGELFVAQWLGSLADLEQRVRAVGFRIEPPWSWQAALSYSDPKAPFSTVPPRPLLHEGLRANLTAVSDRPATPNLRLVLRAFKGRSEIGNDGTAVPVYLISVLEEQNAPRFSLYTMPRSTVPPPADARAIMTGFSPFVLPGPAHDVAPVLMAQP